MAYFARKPHTSKFCSIRDFSKSHLSQSKFAETMETLFACFVTRLYGKVSYFRLMCLLESKLMSYRKLGHVRRKVLQNLKKNEKNTVYRLSVMLKGVEVGDVRGTL